MHLEVTYPKGHHNDSIISAPMVTTLQMLVIIFTIKILHLNKLKINPRIIVFNTGILGSC